VRFLLDTHIWLWLLEQPSRVHAPVLAQLESAEELVLSAASVWEMAIKERLGKLRIAGGVRALCVEARKALSAIDLPVTSEHALGSGELPMLHRDPFDRILIAQARASSLPLVTADEQIRAYGGDIVWARS
jgi:PIN domain nuclease of toxin-antitoxin system